ncbi:hypothetical protein, partial [Salmonella enterica]|uniref:hypothetical protein n=1 Tax=Salmonella enterica TaxID=28901 RepID=UPI003A4C70E7
TVNSADGDITLQAAKGSVQLQGSKVDGKPTVSVTADKGNITISSSTTRDHGMSVNNVSLSAGNNVSIDAEGRLIGAKIRNASITAGDRINLNASASSGGYDSYTPYAGLLFYGDLLFKSGNGTTINATHTSHTANYSPPTALVLANANLTFDGGAEINACASYAAITVSMADFDYWSDQHSSISVKNGDLDINARLDGKATTGPTGAGCVSSSGAIVFNNGGVDGKGNNMSLRLNVDNGSDVTINADSSANKSGPFAAFASATPEATAATNTFNGFVFTGEGNVTVHGKSDSADAVNLRLFDNTALKGNLTITGESHSGTGVNFDKTLSAKVINATITGKSDSGVGVKMTAEKGYADLNGNSISGSTATGKGGVMLSGSNVTITNGTLNGSATSGNGSG